MTRRTPRSATTETTRATIARHGAGQAPARAIDELATEEPLGIRVNNRDVAVLMRTPGHDEELATGFLVSEGLLRSHDDLIDLGSCLGPDNTPEPNIMGVKLAPGANQAALRRLTRRTVTGSSCGTCGKTSIADVHLDFPPLARRTSLRASVLHALPAAISPRQQVFRSTGGLHAAALFTLDGTLAHLREDVGRHNAVDKIIGRALLDRLLPLSRHILFVSGRVSFEIMQKALAARIPIVAGISAPTSLAVEFARASRQTLAGFVRDGRFNVYAGMIR